MPSQMQQPVSNYRFAYRAYADALYDSLAEDPFYITLEASVMPARDGREAMLEYLDYSIRESDEYGQVCIPEAHRQGVSVWQVPQQAAPAAEMKRRKRDFLLDRLGADSLRTYERIVTFMSARSSALVDAADWYLSIVGILPRFQNQGLGAQLIEPVLERADAAGVDTWLETFTPRNQSFYRRLGYRVLDSFEEPTTGASYALMARPNGAAS